MATASSLQATPPSLSKQKSFIVENAGILNRETKLAILRIVMQEVGEEAVMENSGTKEVDINLDICATSNEDVVRHVYNMVRARLDSLNQPAGRNIDPQRGRTDADDISQSRSTSETKASQDSASSTLSISGSKTSSAAAKPPVAIVVTSRATKAASAKTVGTVSATSKRKVLTKK